MRTSSAILTVIALCAATAASGYFVGSRHAASHDSEPADTAPAEQDHVVAEVATIKLQRRHLVEHVRAHGTVFAPPASVRIVSFPFETRVTKVLASVGNAVAANDELIELEPSADAVLALIEARNAAAVADNELKQTERRFSSQLATNIELAASKQAAQSAKVKLDALIQRGADKPQSLKADVAGQVTKVNVQEGQVGAAGTPLLEITPDGGKAIRLLVEPGDADFLQSQSTVDISRVGGASPDASIKGKVRANISRVDPVTRSVEIIVDPATPLKWLADTFVVGEFEKASADGWIVPRDAALADGEGVFAVFTVVADKAVRHAVKLGVQTADEVEVITDDLHAGDAVVVSGNARLEDGMSLEASPATAPTAAAAATTQGER